MDRCNVIFYSHPRLNYAHLSVALVWEMFSLGRGMHSCEYVLVWYVLHAIIHDQICKDNFILLLWSPWSSIHITSKKSYILQLYYKQMLSKPHKMLGGNSPLLAKLKIKPIILTSPIQVCVYLHIDSVYITTKQLYETIKICISVYFTNCSYVHFPAWDEKRTPRILLSQPYFHMHISISESAMPFCYIWGIRLWNFVLVRNL